jgi:hypothetical protein
MGEHCETVFHDNTRVAYGKIGIPGSWMRREEVEVGGGGEARREGKLGRRKTNAETQRAQRVGRRKNRETPRPTLMLRGWGARGDFCHEARRGDRREIPRCARDDGFFVEGKTHRSGKRTGNASPRPTCKGGMWGTRKAAKQVPRCARDDSYFGGRDPRAKPARGAPGEKRTGRLPSLRQLRACRRRVLQRQTQEHRLKPVLLTGLKTRRYMR